MAIGKPSSRIRCREAQVLAECAGVRADPTIVRRAGGPFQRDFDWPSLLALAQWHGLTALLYWRLNAVCPETLPAEIRSQLWDSFRTNKGRNLVMAWELRDLLARFGAAGVPVLCFKGLALAADAYGNLALREMEDLDLLVHEQDVPAARDVLASQGYLPILPLTEQQDRFYRRQQYAYQFEHTQKRFLIELHWQLSTPQFRLGAEPAQLWERARTLSIGGTPALTFSAEDTLLYACVHGARHAWERLIWVCDVAELVRAHPEMDWEWLWQEAAHLGVRRVLALGLLLAQRLLHAPLPEAVASKAAADRRAQILAEEVAQRLLSADLRSLNIGQDLVFRLQVRERWSDKVYHALGHAHLAFMPSAAEWTRWRLPRPLFFLYYLVRPVRLAGKYLGQALRRLGRREASQR